MIALIVLGIGAMIVFIIAYGLVNYFAGIGNSAGPANTAADFLVNLQSQTYDQAYKDLDAVITGTLHPQDFQSMAQANDRCYGTIKDFNEISGSAVVTSTTQTFTYSVTRGKLTKPYSLTLTLQKDPNDPNGNWDITKFSDGNGTPNDLGPAPPTC